MKTVSEIKDFLEKRRVELDKSRKFSCDQEEEQMIWGKMFFIEELLDKIKS